jgi:tetratricopeptide (TPR) repeat protein
MVVLGDSLQESAPREAQSLLERSIERAEGCGHDRMVARAATELVWVYSLRQPNLAEQSASLARGAIARLGGDAQLEGWLANNTSAVLALQGRFDESKAAAERAVELKVRAVGHDHVDTCLSMIAESMALLRLGRLQEALALIEEAAAISKRWLESKSEGALNLRAVRADILSALGRYDEAEAEYGEALSGMAVGLNVGRTTRGLAQVMTSRGRPRHAMELLERALSLQDNDSPFEIADTQFALAEARGAAIPRDREAMRLAHAAAATYATTPYFPRERARIAAWLQAHHSARSD